MDLLIKVLSQHFSLDSETNLFNLLFPFSNEDGYKDVLHKLHIMDKLIKMENVQVADKDRIKVGLLFGESHFLSLLPMVSNYLDLIILADIEPRQHKHFQHMLDCLRQANTREAYRQLYLTNNPILNETVSHNSAAETANIAYLERNIKYGGTCEKYYFLFNDEQFNACKSAAEKLKFLLIKLDLTDENKCGQLSVLLKQYNAIIKLCNLTNIHHYDEYKKLEKSIPYLLADTPNCLIMYAEGKTNKLKTTISKGLDEYYSVCLNKIYSVVEAGNRHLSQTQLGLLTASNSEAIESNGLQPAPLGHGF